MLGDDALEPEIAILQHGEVRRELAKGYLVVFAALVCPATLPSPANDLLRYAACA